MTIRPAWPGDALAIARIHVAAWRSTYRRIVSANYLARLSVRERETRWKTILAAPSRDKIALVAGDPVAGFLSAGPSRDRDPLFTAELYAIYLRPGTQAQGLGSRLVAEFARRMKALGHESAHLWVLAANPACGFYERMGARLVRSSRFALGGRVLEELCYGWSALARLS